LPLEFRRASGALDTEHEYRNLPTRGSHIKTDDLSRDVLPQPMARLTDEQRAALQMLAASARGHALSTLLVRGCDFEMLQGFVRAGWATARQHAFGRGRPKILNVRITEAGRKAIAE
jgi:hypothetical protein